MRSNLRARDGCPSWQSARKLAASRGHCCWRLKITQLWKREKGQVAGEYAILCVSNALRTQSLALGPTPPCLLGWADVRRVDERASERRATFTTRRKTVSFPPSKEQAEPRYCGYCARMQVRFKHAPY